MSLKVWCAASVHTTIQLKIFEDTNSDQEVKLTDTIIQGNINC